MSSSTFVVLPGSPVSERFGYTPFDPLSYPKGSITIRLLELLPGESDSIVEARLSETTLRTNTYDNQVWRGRFGNTPLDRGKGFAALSYEWGHLTSSLAVIKLNGKPFTIRPHLWEFLNQIRKQWATDLPIRLWIDSICINQDDLEEKAGQVQIMHKIYAHAREVLVWLGPEADLSGKVFQALREYVEEMKIDERYSKKPAYARTGYVVKVMRNTNEHLKRYNILPSSILSSDDDIRTALVELCRRSYWTRAWIIQECLNAKDVTLFCGNEQLPHAAFPLLGNFCSTIRQEEDPVAWALTHSDSALRKKSSSTLDPADRVFELTRRWYIERHDGLESLLQSYQGLQCSVLHDKVYALLGLSVEGRGFPVDYSISLHTLLAQTVIFCSESKGKRRTSDTDPVRKTCDSIHIAQLLAKELELSNREGAENYPCQYDVAIPDDFMSTMVTVEVDYLGNIEHLHNPEDIQHETSFRVNRQIYQVLTPGSCTVGDRIFALRGTPMALIYRRTLMYLRFVGLATLAHSSTSTLLDENSPLLGLQDLPDYASDDETRRLVIKPDKQLQDWIFPPPIPIPRYHLQYGTFFLLRLFRFFTKNCLPEALTNFIMTTSPDSAFYASPSFHLPLKQVLDIVSIWPERVRGYEEYCEDLKAEVVKDQQTFTQRSVNAFTDLLLRVRNSFTSLRTTQDHPKDI